MRTAVICFTEHGGTLARTLCEGLRARGIACRAWIKKRGAVPPEGVELLNGTLSGWTKEHFASEDALIFIGAAGIAVRSIAPYIRSKKTDPAVVVTDERGEHAISLLSGHIGGANALTLLTAEILGARPVVTTATDLNGRFAVDAFAARRDLYMDSMETAKAIAAALVEGRQVGMRSAFPVFGPAPEELDTTGEQPLGFVVDVRRSRPFRETLHLVPKATVLGVGCRRGADAQQILSFIERTLSEAGIFPESVCRIASIDLKKDEAGLLRAAEHFGVPLVTYTAEELAAVEAGDGLEESEFVRSVTGVGNVCGRAALKSAGAQKLLIPKTAGGGVTVAAAVTDYTVCMED
ncbi:MAG: cobalt-precorrin 5A hydrolase [Eubacteriales bacterium]|nr:cobalt-precorrin 5A hydrolase [Eubacteriales bacterium]